MKKLSSLLLVLVLVASFALTACGDKSAAEATPDDEVVDVPDTAPEAGDADDAEVPAEGGSADLESFIAEAQEVVDMMSSAMGDTMDVSVSARGDALVFTFQYLIDVGDSDEIKAALEQGMDTQKATFEQIQGAMQEEIPGAYLVVEYLDESGNELLSVDFK